MPFKDETTRYDTWAATCPKCQRTASQDDYPCWNCGHKPLTYVYTVTKYDRRDQTLYGMRDRYAQSMTCQKCHEKPGNFICPTQGCGTRLNKLIHRTDPPDAEDSGTMAILGGIFAGLGALFFWLVFLVVVILVILFLIALVQAL
jgi:hypothetical protein